jgi:NADH-quinone oxidoreductase subunit J
METAVFVVCAAVAISGAVGLVFSRHPVHAALSLVATLFAVAVLFLNQGANLLAAVQVIVYTGAIVVLILFVLMLLGVDREEDLTIEPLVAQRYLAALVGALLAGGLLVVILVAGDDAVTGARSVTQAISTSMPDIRQIGQQLFTTYVFPLELTAALLTIAVVGAVVLVRRPRHVDPLPEPESFELEDDDRVYTAPESPDDGSEAGS